MPDDESIEIVVEEGNPTETLEVSVVEGEPDIIKPAKSDGSDKGDGLDWPTPSDQDVGKRSLALVIVIAVILAATLYYASDPDRGNDDNGNGGGNGNGITLVANFTWADADGDGVVTAKENITFDARSSSPAFVHFSWDFDDGTTDDSNSSVITHSFDSNGYYWVELTIMHGNKNKIVEKQVVVAKEKPPVVDMQLLPNQPLNTLALWNFLVMNYTTGSQLELGNFMIEVYNLTGTSYTKKFSANLSDLFTPHRVDNGTQINPLDDYYVNGVNFTDAPNDMGYLTSVQDNLQIAGDGGFDIQSGDRISLYYTPLDTPAMLDDEAIP
jgi:hypothetical protein